MAYVFEWDPRKATENLLKHGISFDEAMTVFGDPLAILLRDPSHERSERRYLLLGESHQGRLLVVAHADRPPRTRIISARTPTRRERQAYEEES
jgi:uncharacterized DUF497 family protein